MKVYISGKIGEDIPSQETLKKFADAEKKLQALGYETFNPTTSGYGLKAEDNCKFCHEKGIETNWYTEVMNLDLLKLSHCDAIYMLKDWVHSKGAMAEFVYAKALGKKFLFENSAGLPGEFYRTIYMDFQIQGTFL